MYGLWQALIRIPLGIAADWLGRRKPFLIVGLALAALAAFLAGWLAETYGLGTAMIVCVPGSWLLLFLCWFGYYITFPSDAARLRAAMAARRDQLTHTAT